MFRVTIPSLMRAPSLLARCLPGLLPQDRGGVSALSEKDLQLPSPAVEIIPSKTAAHHRYSGENLDVLALQVFKGKVSVADMIRLSSSETAPPKYEGMSFTCTTIPNVLANLNQARDRQSRQPENLLTPSRQAVSASVCFYAGEWEELPTVLSIIRTDALESAKHGKSLSFAEEDFMDGCSSQDGSITGQQDFFSRRSSKLSGSRAWERANESDQGGECGYDVILMTEIPYSVTSLKKLYSLIKKVGS